MANKAIVYAIYPNTIQNEQFQKTFGCCRFVYNQMLTVQQERYKNGEKHLSKFGANNYCNQQLKKLYPFLREVDKFALANAIFHLSDAYNSFFKKSGGFPKYKNKHRTKRTYTTNCSGNNIEIKDNYIKLPKLGKVKAKIHRIPDADWKIKSATVTQTPSGKYYVSVLFEYENQVSQITPQNFLGIDFSMKELYVASDGSSACYPRYYLQALDKLAKEQHKLSNMQKGSNNRSKQRIKVARLHEKVSNQRKDFLHKLSRQIADTYDCVCIEDLDMKAMSQCLNFGKSVSDNGWGMFTAFLKYKLEGQGKQLIKVNKWFASSQTCSVCGIPNDVTKNLSVREWDCLNCGTHHDRDVNAAVNIRNEGMRIVFA